MLDNPCHEYWTWLINDDNTKNSKTYCPALDVLGKEITVPAWEVNENNSKITTTKGQHKSKNVSWWVADELWEKLYNW